MNKSENSETTHFDLDGSKARTVIDGLVEGVGLNSPRLFLKEDEKNYVMQYVGAGGGDIFVKIPVGVMHNLVGDSLMARYTMRWEGNLDYIGLDEKGKVEGTKPVTLAFDKGNSRLGYGPLLRIYNGVGEEIEDEPLAMVAGKLS